MKSGTNVNNIVKIWNIETGLCLIVIIEDGLPLSDDWNSNLKALVLQCSLIILKSQVDGGVSTW